MVYDCVGDETSLNHSSGSSSTKRRRLVSDAIIYHFKRNLYSALIFPFPTAKRDSAASRLADAIIYCHLGCRALYSTFHKQMFCSLQHSKPFDRIDDGCLNLIAADFCAVHAWWQ